MFAFTNRVAWTLGSYTNHTSGSGQAMQGPTVQQPLYWQSTWNTDVKQKSTRCAWTSDYSYRFTCPALTPTMLFGLLFTRRQRESIISGLYNSLTIPKQWFIPIDGFFGVSCVAIHGLWLCLRLVSSKKQCAMQCKSNAQRLLQQCDVYSQLCELVKASIYSDE